MDYRHQLKVSGKLHAPIGLTPVKELPVLIEKNVRWTESRFGRCGEDKNLTLSGIEPGPSSL
jgi:hypothetical protein